MFPSRDMSANVHPSTPDRQLGRLCRTNVS